jgi:alpha-tubulin suppressor-like RCC1 family protein
MRNGLFPVMPGGKMFSMTAKRNLIPIWFVCTAVFFQAVTGFAQPVTAIAQGSKSAHSLFLKGDGSLWAMGDNNFGQLGDDTSNSTNYPEQIVVASNVTAIAAGGSHSLFLKSDGSLWAMGNDYYGQLGDGTSGYFNVNSRPEQIVASNVTAIAAGALHSLFLKSDGSLWAMGANSSGQLGDGTYGGYYACTNIPELIVSSNVTAIAAGGSHSLFLKSDGSLWAMGLDLMA